MLEEEEEEEALIAIPPPTSSFHHFRFFIPMMLRQEYKAESAGAGDIEQISLHLLLTGSKYPPRLILILDSKDPFAISFFILLPRIDSDFQVKGYQR